MRERYIPEAFRLSQAIEDSKKANDTVKEQTLKAELQAVQQEWTFQRQTVLGSHVDLDKKLKPYLYKLVTFIVTDHVEANFLKTYKLNLVNLGYLRRVEFPLPKPQTLISSDYVEVKTKNMTPQRYLQTFKNISQVVVTNLFGDNANLVDKINDSTPPLGTKTLDTRSLNFSFIAHIYSLIIYVSIFQLITTN